MLCVRLALALLVTMLLTPVARSEIVSVEVAGVAGEITSGDPKIVVPFDLGVSFQSIDNITVRIGGEVKTNGTYEAVNRFTGESVFKPFAPQLLVRIPGASTSPRGVFFSLDEPASTWDVEFGLLAPYIDDNFSSLLDGTGDLHIASITIFIQALAAIVVDQGTSIHVIEYPTFEIERVEIIFDGDTTAVPEPSSACLAIMAVVTLTFFSRKRCRAKPSQKLA